MSYNVLDWFRKGTLTESDIIKWMLTNLGGSLYSYMVMLENTTRTKEAEKMKSFRNRIFSVRNDWDATDGATIIGAVALEMAIVKDMLEIYRPGECSILQTPVNDALELANILANYKPKTV